MRAGAAGRRADARRVAAVKRTDWLNDRADVLAAHAEALFATGDSEGGGAAPRAGAELYGRKGNIVAATMLGETAWPATLSTDGIDPTGAPA